MLTNSTTIEATAHDGNRASRRLMGTRAAGAWDTGVIDVTETITLTTPFDRGREDNLDGSIRRIAGISATPSKYERGKTKEIEGKRRKYISMGGSWYVVALGSSWIGW